MPGPIVSSRVCPKTNESPSIRSHFLKAQPFPSWAKVETKPLMCRLLRTSGLFYIYKIATFNEEIVWTVGEEQACSSEEKTRTSWSRRQASVQLIAWRVCHLLSSHLHSASSASDINPGYAASFLLVDIMYLHAGNKRGHSFKLYNAIRFSERFDPSSETIIICPITKLPTKETDFYKSPPTSILSWHSLTL